MSIEVGVDLSVELGKVRDEIARHRQAGDRRAKAGQPVDVRFQQSVTTAASGDAQLAFAGPDAGFYWHVRRIVIGGAKWDSSVAGTGEVYVTGINAVTGTVGGYLTIRDLADIVDQAGTLPLKAFYGLHELPVQQGENLVIVLHSPTATTMYKASIQVQQFRSLPADLDISA